MPVRSTLLLLPRRGAKGYAGSAKGLLRPIVVLGFMLLISLSDGAIRGAGDALVGSAASGNLSEVQLIRVDENCTYYATFQSHNQKVLQNENGIFLTYLVDYEDVAPWPGYWRLMRSTDGGQTFEEVYTSSIVGSKAACIETDQASNVYALCGNGSDRNRPFLIFRFSAERNYTDPEIWRLNNAESGKYCMFYYRGKLFIFNHYGKMLVMNATDGRLLRWKQVVEPMGGYAQTQYPHLFVDEDGTLHHAWTTQKIGEYLYWDIHYAQSRNGGKSWQRADGTRLYCPIKPDNSGKADEIVLPDEFEYHTWLSNMIVKNGKVHFAYLAQTPQAREEYVRIDLGTGRIDKRAQGWSGETISIMGLDGFFATGPGTSPLYFVGRTNSSRIGVIVSYDNGDTWHDWAVSGPVPNNIYSIGGFREITTDDCLIGSFTNQYGKRGDPYFFKVKVAEGPLPLGAILVFGFVGGSSLSRITAWGTRHDRHVKRAR